MKTCPNCKAQYQDEMLFCPECGSPKGMTNALAEASTQKNAFKKSPEEEQWNQDYDERCGNCHHAMEEEDQYCRHCGTPRGEGAFEPYRNIMQCVYGPMPVMRTHQCKKCRYTWDRKLMIDDEEYCPRCGGKCSITPKGKKRLW